MLAIAAMVSQAFQIARDLIPTATPACTLRLRPTTTVDPVTEIATTTWLSETTIHPVAYSAESERDSAPPEEIRKSFAVPTGELLPVTIAAEPPYATITGTLVGNDSVPFDIAQLAYAGEYVGRPSFSNDGDPVWGRDLAGSFSILYFDGAKWVIQIRTAGAWQARFSATSTVMSPDEIPAGPWDTLTNPDAWKPTDPATGTPAVAITTPTETTVVLPIDETAEIEEDGLTWHIYRAERDPSGNLVIFHARQT